MRRRSFQKLALGGLAVIPCCCEKPAAIAESLAEQAKQLENGALTAERLAQHYLERIERLDRSGPQLRSVLETNPDALEIAKSLDDERRLGKSRSPLHGVAILIKDNIDTADRMLTTAGSLALEDSKPREDAPLVKKLRDAGAVILGKTNLSEWANMRSPKSTSGWSARGGLTKNPHVLDHNPSGSSSGSAAAVAAGLCSAAIGTETDGSIVSPANACGIVGLKPTLGLVRGEGIIPITHWQDTAGPMGRSVRDVAMLLDVISEKELDLDAAMAITSLKGRRLGFARHLNGENEEIQKLTQRALDVLRGLGAEIIEIELPNTREVGRTRFRAMLGEFREDLDRYLATREGRVRSMADVIAFNKEHAERELPHFGQEFLEMALALDSAEAQAETKAAREKARRLAREEGIDQVLAEHRIDAVVCSTSDPADKSDLSVGHVRSRGCSTMAATAGYPHLTVPMGFAGALPANLSFFSTAWTEPLLLGLGHAYEQAAQHDMRPRFLASLEDKGGTGS